MLTNALKKTKNFDHFSLTYRSYKKLIKNNTFSHFYLQILPQEEHSSKIELESNLTYLTR